MTLTFETLKKQDDSTSRAVIELLHGDEGFAALSAAEGRDLYARDMEDETKLKEGINIAVAKGVLPADPDVSAVTEVNVLGKNADQVADEIMATLSKVNASSGAAADAASVLILQGLSGTGKGTTVAKLRSRLPRCILWSNGNVFRTVTYLVNEALKGEELKPSFLTPELLSGIMARLKFEQFGEEFDVVIDGKTRVGAIANTLLKEPIVSQRVPTVAEQTQGEVVLFARAAVETLKKAGHNVILEGRAQTLNHIPTPFRFALTIPDMSILGARRAAQRVMAAALQQLTVAGEAVVSEDAVGDAIRRSVKSMI
jgi:cytidylate kinase